LLGQKIEQPFLFTRCHQSTLDENQMAILDTATQTRSILSGLHQKIFRL
jgi:hypothetical protein